MNIAADAGKKLTKKLLGPFLIVRIHEAAVTLFHLTLGIIILYDKFVNVNTREHELGDNKFKKMAAISYMERDTRL